MMTKVHGQVNLPPFEGIVQDSVEFDDIVLYSESVKLKNLTVANAQMDSVLNSIVKNKKSYYTSSYYLTLAKKNDFLYIEIMSIDSHNNIIDFVRRGVSPDNCLRKGFCVLGCIVYNNSYFFVTSYSVPNDAKKKDFDCLFRQTNNEIFIRKDKIDDSLFFIEGPTWLFQYLDGKLSLLSPSVTKHKK